jgi:lysozyme C
MRFNFILFTIGILFINFANGLFISQTMADQIKNKLSTVFNRPNVITGIISAPEFGISHEETVITDDDNQIDDDKYTESEFNIFETQDFNLPIIGQKPIGNENRPRPLINRPSLINRPVFEPSQTFESDTSVEFNNQIENFPHPIQGHRPRLGNLRGNNKFEERTLQMRNYIGDEDIIEYNEYTTYSGPESNPNIKSSSEIGLETNIQSECATANYLRKAGFPESSIGTMVCIAKYESGFNCDATNKNTDGSTDYGEFQINSYWWCSGDPKSKYNGCGVSCSSLFNCQSNANCAYTVWKQQGYTAWYGYINHKSTCDSYPKPC